MIYEHAYILHRNGDNKEALTKLKTIQKDESAKQKHLMSQINYKLSEYDKSVATYQEILDDGTNELDQDEVADIVTNYLACQSSNLGSSTQQVEKFISKYCESPQFEKTYEFYFNLSQVYLKDHCTDQSLKKLREAYEKSKSDDSYKDDQIRFKV